MNTSHIVGRREIGRYYDNGELVVVEEIDWQDWQHSREPATRRHEKRTKLTEGEWEYMKALGHGVGTVD